MSLHPQSTITCPTCGTSKEETMPLHACVFVYECTGCHTVLHPRHGECCVFCSYGSTPCPLSQDKERSEDEGMMGGNGE